MGGGNGGGGFRTVVVSTGVLGVSSRLLIDDISGSFSGCVG